MKVVIIILVLIVIGFAVAIGVSVARSGEEPSVSGAPPTSKGKVDEEALEDWEAPPMAELLGKVASPFAPKLLKSPVEVSGKAGSGLQMGTPGRYEVEPSKKDMRIARLSLVAGNAAKASFECNGEEKEGQNCEQVVCLCSGKNLGEDDVDDCPDPWLKARTKTGKFICRDDDNATALVIYSGGGVIEIEPVAGNAATVSIH
jgi:hypothetical protein